MLDAQVRLRGGEHAALEQQVVVDADGPCDAVLDRHETRLGLARFHRVEDLFAEREAHRLCRAAEVREQRRLAVGTANSLEGDLHPASNATPYRAPPVAGQAGSSCHSAFFLPTAAEGHPAIVPALWYTQAGEAVRVSPVTLMAACAV